MGSHWPGTSSKASTRWPGSRTTSTSPPCTPIRPTCTKFRQQIVEFRAVMTNYGDSATPLWLTEFGWGSAAPDRFGINKGLAGQAQMLRDSFEMLLSHRKAWNVQRLYLVPVARSAQRPGGGGCSFCGSAGLLRYNRNRRSPPTARSGASRPRRSRRRRASPGGRPREASPRTGPRAFSLHRSERDAGSTFVCRVDGGLFKPCSLALHDAGALKRQPRLLRQGDRRPRKREPDRVAILHRPGAVEDDHPGFPRARLRPPAASKIAPRRPILRWRCAARTCSPRCWWPTCC